MEGNVKKTTGNSNREAGIIFVVVCFCFKGGAETYVLGLRKSKGLLGKGRHY